MKTTLLSRIRQRNRITVIALSISAFSYFPQQASAQGVGINTTTPDPSAALDIQSTNKGILIPQVQLQNSVDATTVPNPATGLLIYNKNANGLDGTGFYHNIGTPASPAWQAISRLKLPYNHGISAPPNTSAFRIDNYAQSSTTKAIMGYSFNGTGILAKSDNSFALEVDGQLRIHGGNTSPGSGKILTSDAGGIATWQGAVAFSTVNVKGGGGEVVAKNVDYKVPFNSELYDLGDNYKNFNQSPASSFVAPVRGIYHFDTFIDFALASYDDVDELSSIRADLILKKISGGVETTIGRNDNHANPMTSSALSIDVMLNAGDQVFVTFGHQGAYSHLNLLPSSYFNGRLVISQ